MNTVGMLGQDGLDQNQTCQKERISIWLLDCLQQEKTQTMQISGTEHYFVNSFIQLITLPHTHKAMQMLNSQLHREL
jgi:hypothetical protein